MDKTCDRKLIRSVEDQRPTETIAKHTIEWPLTTNTKIQKRGDGGGGGNDAIENGIVINKRISFNIQKRVRRDSWACWARRMSWNGVRGIWIELINGK